MSYVIVWLIMGLMGALIGKTKDRVKAEAAKKASRASSSVTGM
jgi:hypothetical protein